MTWTPGFSSNCTRFWLSALNTVSTICKTRERVHGQTWQMIVLPYEPTGKKSSFMVCRHLYQLGSHSYRAFMRPRSGKAKRGTSKMKAAVQSSPWMRAPADIVFHSTSNSDFFHPCLYKQRPVVGSMEECQLIVSSLIWSANTLGTEAPARIKAQAEPHPDPLHILFHRQWEVNIKEEAASF